MMGRNMYEYSPLGPTAGTAAKEEKNSGFVAQVLCYSPYGQNATQLGELIDPPGVEGQRSKWGLVTRLAHLDDLVEDGNSPSPFELYKKDNPEQFSLEIKEVTLDGEMPEGIGIWEELIDETAGTGSPANPAASNWILIDPMTRETISKEPELNENGKQKLNRGQPVFKVNDHWFVLNLKFIWRDAPEPPKQPVNPRYGGLISTQRPASTPSTSTSSGSSRKSKLPDLDM